MDRQHYAQLSSIVLAGGALHEALRIVLNRPFPPFESSASHLVSGVLALWWGLAAAALLGRRRGAPIVTASWFFSIFSVLWMLIHGIVVASLTPLRGIGIAYLLAALGLAFLLKRSFDRGLLRHGRDLDPRRV